MTSVQMIEQSNPDTDQEQLLRTLAGHLRRLESDLGKLIGATRKFPPTPKQRADLESLAADFRRQADSLEVDRPLLVIVFMGGTGVGKSTLLNALAGRAIAQSSFTRPTTRDPVVYFHQGLNSDQLDPALQLCRLARHDRPGLEQKILVDTPDIDSNDLENRDKLLALLPVADVVLFVGSQEKYHDEIGWKLFQEQRQRSAFAFVLNKWDRCLTAESGIRPDIDLANDLQAEGFQSPLIFRTNARAWVEAALDGHSNGKPPADLPEGEQFQALQHWLELGLTRLEIEAVKARGVGQLLQQLIRAASEIRPPDLASEAVKVSASWNNLLETEAAAQADVLVGTLEPYQMEVEHHFSVEGQQRYRGLMAAYLRLTTMIRYAGSRLRDRHPITGSLRSGKLATPAEWNLGSFARDCARVAGERVLDQRMSALTNSLLVDADRRGFPIALLTGPTSAVGKLDWRDRATRLVIDSLSDVERRATQPTGWRKALRTTLGFAANVLPEISLIATVAILLWNFFYLQHVPEMFQMSLILLIPLAVVISLHFLNSLLLPFRWSSIRNLFRARLENYLSDELGRVYLAVPGEVAEQLKVEQGEIDQLIGKTNELVGWLASRQEAARSSELYGDAR